MCSSLIHILVNTTINPSNNTLVHEAKITLLCVKSLRKEGEMPICTIIYKKVADVGGLDIKASYNS